MHDAAHADDRLARHVARQHADDDGEEGVGEAECDHVVADVLDADRTADERLQDGRPPLHNVSVSSLNTRRPAPATQCLSV